jgi:SAM-dependent methyltransferase
MTSRAQRAFYERLWAAEAPSPEHDPTTPARLRLILGTLRRCGARRVLDAGCGSGELLEPMRRAGLHAIGLDLPAAAQRARRRRTGSGLVAAGLDEGWPFAAESFDAIVCTEVLEHVFDTLQLLREARRVLRPGGTLVLTVPYHGLVKNLLVVAFNFDAHFNETESGHIRFFSNRSLRSALEQAGFLPGRPQYVGRPWPIAKSVFITGTVPRRQRPSAATPVPITVIVPTRNEERALPDCLASVMGWAAEVFVLDSHSTDRTVGLAKGRGARVFQREFDDFATHKNWALRHLPITHPWVFFLDADERFTPELRAEVAEIIRADGAGYDGFYVGRRNHFMGRWIRHAGWYPNWNLRLFRRGKGAYERRKVHEHVLLSGPAGFLLSDLLHEDVKGLERYFDRHNVYSSLEAAEVHRMLQDAPAQRLQGRLWRRGPEQRRWLKEFGYRYLPGRPLWKFLWMYVVRLGFLDGRVGFRNCVLQMFYEYQVSLKLLELETDPGTALHQHVPHETERGEQPRPLDADARPDEETIVWH